MILCLLLLGYTTTATHLTIAHTNDVASKISQSGVEGGYAYCDPTTPFNTSEHTPWFTGCHGGAPRRKTIVDDLRNTTSNFLLLDAGDHFQGSIWYNIYKSNATAFVMNALEYDAICLGNHEFDDGEAELSTYFDLLNPEISVVSANMDSSEDSLLFGRYNRSVVKTLPSGEQVGIIGFTTTETPDLSIPGPHLHFGDEIAAIQTEVDWLTNAGVNIIIGLGHSGWTKELEIAEQVEGIDVIIGGHTDIFCYTGNPQNQSQWAHPETPDHDYPHVVTQVDTGNMVCMAQAYAYGTWLGKMDIEFDTAGNVISCGGNPIFLDGETVPQDPALLNWTETHWQTIQASYSNIVGQSRASATSSTSVMLTGESAIANLYTDAVVDRYAAYANSIQLSDTRLALLNGGAILADWPVGDVSMGHLLDMMPWGGSVTQLNNIPGSVILQALEYGVSGVEVEAGRFPHFSGLRYTYDMDAPALHRITEAWIVCSTCVALVEQDLLSADSQSETWSVLTLAYLANGGDGYKMLTPYADEAGGYFVDYDVLVQYMDANPPVLPKEEGRIEKVNTTEMLLTNDNACLDYSRFCSGMANNCNDDGTIDLGDGQVYCYETCSCPKESPTPESPLVSLGEEFSCSENTCTVEFISAGPGFAVEIRATDYSSKSQYVEIYVDGTVVNQKCDPNQSNSEDWYTCDGFFLTEGKHVVTIVATPNVVDVGYGYTMSARIQASLSAHYASKKRCNGQKLATVQAATPAECAQACASTDQCVYFTLFNSGNCNLCHDYADNNSNGETYLMATGSAATSDGLVGYWPFSGNAEDGSYYNHHGTVSGGVQLAADHNGVPNQAYDFFQGKILINDQDDLSLQDNTWSVSLWVLISSSPSSSSAFFFCRYRGTREILKIGIHKNKVHVRYNNGAFKPQADEPLLQDTWYHIAAVHAGSELSLYINGNLVDTYATSASMQNSGLTILGADWDGGNNFNQFLSGSLDEVRVYNRALNMADIYSLYYELGRKSVTVSTFGTYPGGTDPGITGTVTLNFVNGDEVQLSWDLDGVDSGCSSGGFGGNSCGIHIHSGTTCIDGNLVSGHYYDTNTISDDPWTTSFTSSGTTTIGTFSVVHGYNYEDSVGKTLVIHDFTGARVTCTVIGLTETVVTIPSFSTYPGYTGDVALNSADTVTLGFVGTKVSIAYSLPNGDSSCSTAADEANSCGIHIHSGNSCVDHSLVGGHYYNSDTISEDPWSSIVYTPVDGGYVATAVETGYTYAESEGKAFVVHGLDGGRVGCALIGVTSEVDRRSRLLRL